MERWSLEHTDTFGGEANYCWVRRETIELPENATRRQIVTAAKRFAGFTGMRCRVDDYGSELTITPSGMCQAVYVTYEGSTDA